MVTEDARRPSKSPLHEGHATRLQGVGTAVANSASDGFLNQLFPHGSFPGSLHFFEPIRPHDQLLHFPFHSRLLHIAHARFAGPFQPRKKKDRAQLRLRHLFFHWDTSNA
jgi:hypothetical protein